MEELSVMLGVSEVTIRSDLNYLVEQGVVRRSFGKASAADMHLRKSKSPPTRLTHAAAAPMMRTTLQLIEPEQTLLIGPGDLPQQLVPLLVEVPGLILMLASIDAVLLAQRCLDCEIHVIGGRIGPDGVSLEGPQALQSLHVQLIDTVVVQAKAIDKDGALVMPTQAAEQFCRLAFERARRCIGLITSPQASLETTLFGVPLKEADDLVFPSAPDTSCQEVLASLGFRLDSAEAPTAAHYQNNGRSRHQEGGQDMPKLGPVTALAAPLLGGSASTDDHYGEQGDPATSFRT